MFSKSNGSMVEVLDVEMKKVIRKKNKEGQFS